MENKTLLAVFDLDGTVLDTLDDLADSVNFALETNGYGRRSTQEVRSFVGNGVKNLIKRSLPESSDDAAVNRVLADFKARYAVHCADKTKPYDGITETITALRAVGIKTAVISNKTDSAVQKLVKKYFDGLFNYVAGEKEGVARKPAPDSVNAALEALGIKKENAVYIGDSEVDILTAKNAGLRCITVLWGFRDEDFLKANGAENMAHTMKEMEKLI